MTTTPTIYSLLTEARRLEGERTPAGWRLAVDEEVHDWWADAAPNTVVVQQDHDDATFAIAATCDDGIPSERNVADAAFIAFWGTHAPALLAYVGELEQERERLKEKGRGRLLAEVQRTEAEAEVTRLTAQWEALKAWASAHPYGDSQFKMAELEAQR